MSADKNNTLDFVGIPKEFVLLLLTLALILTISPYMGGVDLGIFKVPLFSPRVTSTLRYLGPLIVVLLLVLFMPLWKPRSKPSIPLAYAVDADSKYRLQSIADIVKGEAAGHGFRIDGIQIGDRLHISDLERICTKTWFPSQSPTEVSSVLQAARAKAFSRKYAEPKEDEKLTDISMIKIDKLRPWVAYFTDLLNDLGIEDPNQLDVLDVGIGNGYAEEPFLSKLHSFKAVDISEEALQYARKKYPQMNGLLCSAENLKEIPNNSIDFYLSLRTYQSTLFDRRASLHEAYRVLRNGGIIVVSIPIMFLRKNGEALSGLIQPGSSEPSMEYAHRIVTRIHDYLTILNFSDVKVDTRSPFEIFMSARR